tara:strand:+ start:8736 stop:9203 length:468 start_codon:yes stop_codon:yes gene_type:complete
VVRNDLTNKEIENKIKIYCSYQDRCHKDVVLKLKDFNIDNNGKNEIISNLIKENYLNESRYCKSFARGKFRIKNWGRIKIKNELKLKDISSYNISLALKEIDDKDYIEKLDSIFKKKLSSLGNINVNIKRKKIFSFLKYRGWENNLIFDKINEIH